MGRNPHVDSQHAPIDAIIYSFNRIRENAYWENADEKCCYVVAICYFAQLILSMNSIDNYICKDIFGKQFR